MTAPMNGNEVVQHLARLARDLDTTVAQLEQADLDATTKRAEFDLAFSQSFVSCTGSVDFRKHTSAIATADQRMAADVADSLVRHLRRRIDALKIRIDVGRSYGAAIRAEINLGGVHQT